MTTQSEPGDGMALAEEKIGVAVAKRFAAEERRFDPTIIITIITAILSLLGGCPKVEPKNLRRQKSRQNLRTAQLAARIRRETGVSNREAVGLAEAAYDASDLATDADLQLFIDQCCD